MNYNDIRKKNSNLETLFIAYFKQKMRKKFTRSISLLLFNKREMGFYRRPTPHPPPTHQKAKTHENKHSTMQETGSIVRISGVKNVNKRKNRLTPAKLESKKQDKKLLASREGLVGKPPSSVRKKPRPIQPHLQSISSPISVNCRVF